MPVEPHLAAPTSLRFTLSRLVAIAAVVTITVLWAPLGNTGAYIAIILAGIAAVLGWRNDVLALVLRQQWVWLFLLAFVSMAAATLLNGDPNDTIYIGDFLFMPFGIVFAVAFFSLRGRIGDQGLSWLYLLGAAAAVAVGVSDVYVQGQARAHGMSNSPIHFANMAVIVGFMALAGTFGASRRAVWLLYAAPVLGLLAATLAGTRGAYVVAAALAILFAIFVVVRRPERVALKLAGIAALIVLLGLAAAVGHALGFSRPFETFQVLQELFAGKQLEDTSSAYRLAMYQSGIRAFFDAPFFGHGWHNQVTAALPYMDDFARQGYAVEQWSYIHNEPLGFALAGGVLGIVAYCALMCAPLFALRQIGPDSQSVPRAYLACTLIVGLFVGGMTDVLFMTELSKTFYVAMTAAIMLLCVDAPPKEVGANG